MGRWCSSHSCFFRPLCPMPDAASDAGGQRMAKLAGGDDDLAAMMTFMRDEIRQNVSDVEWKIAPDIRARSWNLATMFTAKHQELAHSIPAAIQRGDQLLALDIVAIDSRRRDDAMRLAERLQPHAS